MIPKNSNWKDKPQVIKGDYAEEIINKYLEDKGFVVYNTKTNKAHAFDKLAIRDKKDVIIAECKAKAKRIYYDDTGIDLRHYNEYGYMFKKHKIPVFIFFIDEMLKEIYGNFLETLSTEIKHNGIQYPLIRKGIIYFPMVNMRKICKLNDEQVAFLKEHSTRSYEYQ